MNTFFLVLFVLFSAAAVASIITYFVTKTYKASMVCMYITDTSLILGALCAYFTGIKSLGIASCCMMAMALVFFLTTMLLHAARDIEKGRII